MKQQVGSKFGVEMQDPGDGEHLWIFTALFSAGPTVIDAMKRGQDPGDVHFDSETLINILGPMCFKCEEAFDTRIVYRKCKGQMDLMPLT